MDIRVWRERPEEPLISAPAETIQPEHRQPAAPAMEPPSAPDNKAAIASKPSPPARQVHQYPLNDWDELLTGIEACHNCALGERCTRKVPGKGNREADLMIIGEAPGAQEDRQGMPFVGRAGQLLDRMLRAIDLDTESVYITNILKCRPPNNRDPQPKEVAACQPFLQAQIRLLQPKVILSVGRISAQNLLGNTTALGKLRGRTHQLPSTDTPLLVTYHPAYLLRNPEEKSKGWQDLKLLAEKFR